MNNRLAECSQRFEKLKKPSALSAAELVEAYPHIFEAGKCRLAPGESVWNTDKLLYYHGIICSKCGPTCGEDVTGVKWPHPQCYFHKLWMIILNGWCPDTNPDVLAKLKSISTSTASNVDINHPGARAFPSCLDAAVDDLLASGKVRYALPNEKVVISPMNVVIKKSDITRAKILVNINIDCQRALDVANNLLRAMTPPQPIVKSRAVIDLTKIGVNSCWVAIPFSAPTSDQAIELVERGDTLSKSDIIAYYLQFSLAAEFRWLVGFKHKGKIIVYLRIPFGIRPAPLVTAAFSAELGAYGNIILRIPLIWIVDDFMTRAISKEKANENMDAFEGLVASLGLSCVKEKRETNQVLPFIGITIDTVNMVVTMDSVQAFSTAKAIDSFINKIKAHTHVSHGLWHSTVGKLQWYSGVIQRGRLWLRSLWHYKSILQHNEVAGIGITNAVLADLECWSTVLSEWSNKRLSGREVPILSMTELKNTPNSIVYVQTDASGELSEGRGGFYGSIDENNPNYFSLSWNSDIDELHSSQFAELCGLRDCLLEFADTPLGVSCKLILWASDAQAGVFSVNSSIARSDPSFIIMSEILHICELRHWQIIATWIPRTSNTNADLLSHLAPILGLNRTSGKLSDLSGI